MRILQVANGYPPGAMGGVETYTRQLAARLVDAGHALRVFCREEAPGRADGDWRDDAVDGVTVRRVTNNFVRVSGFADYYVNRDIELIFERSLREWRPEIVHFQHAIGLSASLPLVAAAEGVPTVWTLWDYWPICPVNTLLLPDGRLCPGSHHPVNCFECVYGAPRPFPGRHIPEVPGDDGAPEGPRHPFGLTEGTVHTLRRALPRPVRLRLLDAYNALQAARRRVARAHPTADRADEALALPPPAVAYRAGYMREMLEACDRLVAPLPFVADTYRAFGVSEHRIRQIEPGMPVGDWPRTARGAPPADRPLRLGYIGSLMRHKGVAVLVDALAAIPAADVELRLHGFFVPGDPFGSSLARRARRDRRIRLMGPYEHGQLPHILAEMDVLLMPARWHETFSFVTREAILAGLPVLAADMGGMRYAVQDGRNGRLLPPGDAEAWAAAIVDLVRDRGQLAGMSEASAAWPIRTSEEDAADLARLYREVVAERGVRGAGP